MTPMAHDDNFAPNTLASLSNWRQLMKVLAMVLAGGQGSRLHPLTADRSKPAVPYGSRYRIADFVLSNLINSEIHGIFVLVQYKSQSLIEHVTKAWGHDRAFANHFITVVPPQMREGPEWFQGTSDAIFQNINLIERHAPDIVAIFGADHIYRMDVRQMVELSSPAWRPCFGGGDSGAARRGIGLRHHRHRSAGPHPRLSGKAQRSATDAQRPEPRLRIDGQLPV